MGVWRMTSQQDKRALSIKYINMICDDASKSHPGSPPNMFQLPSKDLFFLCKSLLEIEEKMEIAKDALLHLVDKKYECVDEGRNYTPNYVCNELYTDKPLHEWAMDKLKDIDKA